MKLGEKQKLVITKEVDFGVYLSEHPQDRQTVLLPAKQVPKDAATGDEVEVFLYKDSKDRLIATTKTPYLVMDGVAALKVVETNDIGAFLDWGLEKDLFLPYKEMTRKLKAGDEVLVRLYIDKSSRLCASMRYLYDLLQKDSPCQKGDTVSARIYEFSGNFGTFAAVDDRYSAMIPSFEDCSHLKIGDITEARVTNVKPDGKLDLTIRRQAYLQMDEDAEAVLKVLDSYGGVLPFNDKASPEVIKREFKMSKNAFKRAVGRLYKEQKIEITEKSIRKL